MEKKDPNIYPSGLNRKKVQQIISYYEQQTDSEAIADGEAAFFRKRRLLRPKPNTHLNANPGWR